MYLFAKIIFNCLNLVWYGFDFTEDKHDNN